MKVDKKEVIKMRQTNQCATLQEIGNRFGVSRERIRQILSTNNIQTKNYKWLLRYYCLECGTELVGHGRANRKFCSVSCCNSYKRITVMCDNCGALFKRRASELLWYPNTPAHQPKHSFCSRKCLGSYTGKHYGFGAHPRTCKKG